MTLFFSRNIVCVGHHRKTWIQAVCALCTHPSFSQSVSRTDTQNPYAAWSNFAFKSCSLTQRGSFLPNTSSEKRENQKRHKEMSRYSIGRKLILSLLPCCEITVGTHGPCCLCIPLAFCHWWFVRLHNEYSTVGGVNNPWIVLLVSIYVTYYYYLYGFYWKIAHIQYVLSRMHKCVQYYSSIFRGVEIFTALLATGNTGIVSHCCLQICMYTNDVSHFVYGISNEA